MGTRRNFLFSCVKTGLLLPFIWIASCTKKEDNAPEKNLLSEDDPLAKSLKYTKDGTSSDANVAKTNHDAPVDEQICKNCQFYKPIGDDYGNCITLKGNVTAGGWCTTWAKKIPIPNS